MIDTCDSSCMKRKYLITSSILTILILAVYWQTGSHAFINLDDQAYLYENQHIADGLTSSSIIWAITSIDYFYWQPVTWLSHMIDVELYGMKPGGHHLSNVCIHIASTILLLYFLFRLTGFFWQSAFVAAMFALHPMHVESVAWAAERKDVLSVFFGFLTLIFYSEYKIAIQTPFNKRRRMFYLLSLICFMLGLMSKPMLVTLPIVILLIEYWSLSSPSILSIGILRTQLTEAAPFILLSTVSAIITIYGQNNAGAMPTIEAFPFALRFENAVTSYTNYIIKTIYPSDLAVYYPMPATFSLWHVACSLLALVIVSVVVIFLRVKYRYLAVGWFWFLISLFPVIGLTQAGFQAMADRFSYLPHIGLFIMAAWGVADLTKDLRQQKILLALLATFAISASAISSWRQTALWKNSIILFEHTLQVTENNWMALNNLGKAYLDTGRVDDALWCFQESVKVNPSYTVALVNLGALLAAKNRNREAHEILTRALQIDPFNEKALMLLSNLPMKP